MELYFLRHGLAGKASEWEGDDWDRPLTEEGKERMTREAETLASACLAPDLILSSPLARALQTAEIIAGGLDLRPELMIEKRLAPGFGPKQLGKILAQYGDRRSLLLVGHEPDFSKIISYLIGGGRVICKKGGLVSVELPDPRVLRGDLVLSIPPSLLAEGCLNASRRPIYSAEEPEPVEGEDM